METIVNNSLNLIKNVSVILFLCLCLMQKGMAKPVSSEVYKYPANEQAQHYPRLNYTLIELIKALPKPPPMAWDKAQKLFNNKIYLRAKNELFRLYDGGHFITKDGVVIDGVSISTRNNNERSVVSIGFSLDQKQCVNTEMLKKRFGFHKEYLKSPHPMIDPPISFDADYKWGEFSVGTTLDHKDCATGVVVRLRT